MKSGYQLLKESEDKQLMAPPFFAHKTVYAVMSKYLDLNDLANLSATEKRGRAYLMNLLNNQPELFLNALLRMPKAKIASFLRKFPYNLEIIEDLHHRLPNNPAAFTLWAMVTNTNIDATRLSVCINYFKDQGHFRAVKTLGALKQMAWIAHCYRMHPVGKLEINNITKDAYQNYQGLHLCNLVAPNNTSLKFEDIDFSGANFCGAIFENVTFVNCNFTGADLSHVRFVNVKFYGTNNFTNANLSFADLSTIILRHAMHRLFIFDGADFTGTRFFSNEITTHGHILDRLNDLPFPFLSPSSDDHIQERRSYLAVYGPVTNSFIATVMAYTEEQYAMFMQTIEFQAWYEDSDMTLQEFQCFLFKKAMHQMDYFSQHRTMGMFQLNDFLKIEALKKNAIFTPAQRKIKEALRQLQGDDMSCCISLRSNPNR